MAKSRKAKKKRTGPEALAGGRRRVSKARSGASAARVPRERGHFAHRGSGLVGRGPDRYDRDGRPRGQPVVASGQQSKGTPTGPSGSKTRRKTFD
jgi:hypothetical protein